MRIAMVALSDFAGDARLRRHAEALAARGHVVHVLAVGEPGSPAGDTTSGVRVTDVRLSRSHQAPPYGFAESLRFGSAAAWHLSRRPYDLVQVRGAPGVLASAARIARLRGAAVIVDVDTLAPFQRIASRFPDALIYGSQTIRDRVSQGSKVKRGAIFIESLDDSASDPTAWRGGAGEGVFRVVYLGRLDSGHGLESASAAIAQARSDIPGLVFDIHPWGDDTEGASDLAQKALIDVGLGDVATIHPPVTPDALPGILAAADVGLVTEQIDDGTVPRLVREMVAASVPVVVVRTAPVEDTFESGGILLCHPGDPASCAEHLGWVFAHPEEARSQANTARITLRSHSWEREEPRYVDFVMDLIDRRRKT